MNNDNFLINWIHHSLNCKEIDPPTFKAPPNKTYRVVYETEYVTKIEGEVKTGVFEKPIEARSEEDVRQILEGYNILHILEVMDEEEAI